MTEEIIIENAFHLRQRLEQENKELRQQYNCYACDTCQGKEDYRNMKRHCENAIKTVHTYRSALEEIREIARVNAITTCWSVLNFCDECKEDCEDQSPIIKLKEIVKKINEVLQ